MIDTVDAPAWTYRRVLWSRGLPTAQKVLCLFIMPQTHVLIYLHVYSTDEPSSPAQLRARYDPWVGHDVKAYLLEKVLPVRAPGSDLLDRVLACIILRVGLGSVTASGSRSSPLYF